MACVWACLIEDEKFALQLSVVKEIAAIPVILDLTAPHQTKAQPLTLGVFEAVQGRVALVQLLRHVLTDQG